MRRLPEEWAQYRSEISLGLRSGDGWERYRLEPLPRFAHGSPPHCNYRSFSRLLKLGLLIALWALPAIASLFPSDFSANASETGAESELPCESRLVHWFKQFQAFPDQAPPAPVPDHRSRAVGLAEIQSLFVFLDLSPDHQARVVRWLKLPELIHLLRILNTSSWQAHPQEIARLTQRQIDAKVFAAGEIERRIRTGPFSSLERLAMFRWHILESHKFYVTEIQGSLEDAILGLDISATLAGTAKAMAEKGGKEAVYGRELIWQEERPGLLSYSMPQTPYGKFHSRIGALGFTPEQKFRVIDIGAGFGRLGIYLGVFYPNAEFLGYEIVQERVQECNRISRQFGFYPRVRCQQQNLADPAFHLEEADLYYAYAPTNLRTGEKVMRELKSIAERKNFLFLGFMSVGAGESWMELDPIRNVHLSPPIRNSSPQ